MEHALDATLDHAKHLAKYLSHCSSTYIIQIALKELGLPSNRDGFHLAKCAIWLLYENPINSLSKKIYGEAAARYHFPTDHKQVEQAIRMVVKTAWSERDPDIWNCYFPVGSAGRSRCPSNKEFMMAVVDFVELWKGFCEEEWYGQQE